MTNLSERASSVSRVLFSAESGTYPPFSGGSMYLAAHMTLLAALFVALAGSAAGEDL